MFAQSTQSQFLVPMAVSMGCGIVVATAVTLVLVPLNFIIYRQLTAARAEPSEPADELAAAAP